MVGDYRSDVQLREQQACSHEQQDNSNFHTMMPMEMIEAVKL